MMLRPLVPSDIPYLRMAHAQTGFAYEFPNLQGPLMQAVLVLADDDNQPLLAFAAEAIPQGYFFVCQDLEPAVKIAAIHQIEREAIPLLKAKGYTCCDVALPPQVAKSFGRRLERTFGWSKNWPSWGKSF